MYIVHIYLPNMYSSFVMPAAVTYYPKKEMSRTIYIFHTYIKL